MAPPTRPALKILMLHGYTQSGPLFHAKTRALEKSIQKAFPGSTLHYPTGPIALRASDIPGYVADDASKEPDSEIESYGWWRRKEGSTTYTGLSTGLARIADTILKEGPFDGAIGFSQGGCAVALLASLSEPGRREAFQSFATSTSTEQEKFPFPESFLNEKNDIIQRPLKFIAVYSGFAAPKEVYGAFYTPKIITPSVHFLGSLDTVVDEGRSRSLLEACELPVEYVHPGGHFLPSQKVWVEALLGFIGGCCGEEKKNKKGGGEEKGVEDMDVPF